MNTASFSNRKLAATNIVFLQIHRHFRSPSYIVFGIVTLAAKNEAQTDESIEA